MSIWSGFFKKTLRERQDQIRLVFPHADASVLNDGGLPGSVADVMVSRIGDEHFFSRSLIRFHMTD